MGLRYIGGAYSIFAIINGIKEAVGENLSSEEAINAIQEFGQRS